MAELEINTHIVGYVPTIHLRGELDSYSAPRVRHILETFTFRDRPAVIVNLMELEYIDSAGLGVLVAGLRQATENSGMLALVSPAPTVARVLHVTGLDTLFTVFTDETEAQQQMHLVVA